MIETPKFVTNRELYFTGDVNEDICTRMIMTINDINLSDEYYASSYRSSGFEYTPKPIILHISTFGGSVHDALGLYDCIRKSKTPVKTIGVGKVMSAGVILFLAAKERAAYDNTTFMIHQISGGVIGKMSEIEATAEEYKRVAGIVTRILCENTELEEDDVTSVKEDWYMNTEEAELYGLINSKL